jgi:hypothetical protein
VIGPDGTCKVCGRAAQNWGDERKRGLIDPPDEDGDADLDPDDDHELAADARDDDGEYGEDSDEDGDDGEDDGDDDGGDEDDDHGDAGNGRAGREPAVAALTASSGEWSTRRLCGDGSCIGLLGPSGRCKVCGRTPAEAAAGAPRRTDATTTTAATAATTAATAATTAATAATTAATATTTAAAAPGAAEPVGDALAPQTPEAASRVACPDAGCTGAIGPDGRCNVCGKAAA